MNKLKSFYANLNRKLLLAQGSLALYNIGVDSYSKKNYTKAIEYFKLAIEHKNAIPQAYYNLGLSYQRINDYNRAVIAYSKFLSFYKKDYDGLYNLALTYYQNENFTKAAEYFEKCIEVKPDEDGVKSLTLSYLQLQEPQKAIKLSEKMINIPEAGLKLAFASAEMFEKTSGSKDHTNIDIAIDLYKKIIDKDATFFDAYLALSISYGKKGEWENSVLYCRKAIEMNPESFEANNQMGLVYYCCEETQEAVKYYEHALNLRPEGDYKVYSNLGYAYEKIGSYNNAIKIFSKLIAKFPKCNQKEEFKEHLRFLKSM